MRRTASISSDCAHVAAAALAAAALLACSRGGAVQAVPPRDASDVSAAAQIRTLMQRSADAWNRGDLEGFLEPYLRSDQTTYIGSTGLRRGFDALREGYRTGYFASGRPEDRLEFEDIDVRTLGDSHALAIGRYRLVDRESGETTDEGIYSLTLVRTDAGWRIIHDHSSSLSGG